MLTETQDIDCAHRVTWAGGPTVRAEVYPAVLIPLPAYGTRLRGIGFAEGDRPSRLVIELLNHLAGAGRAHLLGLHPSGALRGVIERLPHIARRTRKRTRNRVRRLVRGIAYLALGPVEHLILAPLQPLPAARAFALLGLCLLDACQRLVAPLDDRFYPTPAYQKNRGAIGGGNEGIHSQVHADNSLLQARHVGYLTDEAHGPYDSRTSVKRPATMMVSGNRMRSVPLLP